jgi:hypothetical protein
MQSNSLVTSSPSKKHHRGLFSGAAVLCVHKVTGQATIDKRHLDDFNVDIGHARERVKAVDASLVNRQLTLILGVRKRSAIR